MPIEVIDVTQADVDKVLKLEEGHFVDLKAIEVAPGKLTKSLSAFANADGGELYVGIDEDKKSKTRAWRGFSEPEAANAHIQVCESLFPSGARLCSGELLMHEEDARLALLQTELNTIQAGIRGLDTHYLSG